MPKQQKTYTKEFKQEAVRLVENSGKSMSQVARDLGVADSTLYHWCQQLSQQGEQAFPGSGHQTSFRGGKCAVSSANWKSCDKSATF